MYKRFTIKVVFALKKIITFLSVAVMLIFCAMPVYASKKNITILLDGSSENEYGSYNNLCIEGLKMAEKHIGRKKISVRYLNALENKSKLRSYLEAAASTSDLVIAAGESYYEFLHDAIIKYPECFFVTFNGEETNDSNSVNITIRDEEGGFLAGALAALMTVPNDKYSDKLKKIINNEKKVGIVLGEKRDTAQMFKLGFEAGVKYIDRDTIVLAEYCGSFSDRKKCASAADKLKSEGAEIIFLASGAASIGGVKLAAQKGFFVIGVDVELEKKYPDVVLVSIVKRTERIIETIIKDFMINNRDNMKRSIGVSENCIEISTWTRESKSAIPITIRRQIEEIEDKLSRRLIKIKHIESPALN